VSAFIAMFRRAVGMTPTAYLNSIGAGVPVPARRLGAGMPMEGRVS